MFFSDLIAGLLPARLGSYRASLLPLTSRTKRSLKAESLEPRLTLSAVTMTANEQLLVELINRARANPQAEVNRIVGISDLNQGLPAGTITNTPKQPLAPHQALVTAAGNHSTDMLLNDYFDHYSQNGASPTRRAMDAGYPNGVAENIAWGGSTGSINQIRHVTDRHEALLISPGHRLNLLDDDYREIGTGVRYGVFTVGGFNYNASMVTENFGLRAGNAFITGVAYSDAVVDDDFYTIGEGAGGVLITATNESSHQVFSINTGPSGGYSLQLPDGTYTVTAVGGEINGQVQHPGVVVDGRNVKVDIVTTEGTPPSPPGGTSDDPAGGGPPNVPTNGISLLGRSGGVWWQARSTGVNLVNQQSGVWSDQVSWHDVQPADIDGDGRDEIIGRAGNGRWWVARSDSGVFHNESWGFWSPRARWKNVLVGDFNGDGMDDIVGRAANGSWWVARSTGSEFVSELWGSWTTRVNWQQIQVGDFDGDGQDDLVGRANNGAWWVARSLGDSFASQAWGSWSNVVNWKNIRIGDFNGDGRDEIVGQAGRNWWIAESTGSSFVNRRWTTWASAMIWDDIRIGDVDGDGRDDVLGRSSGNWWVMRTNATEVVNEQWGSWDPFQDWDDILIVDLDRDGLDDIAGRSGNDWWAARSNSKGFDSSLWGQWPNSQDWDFVFAGDFG